MSSTFIKLGEGGSASYKDGVSTLANLPATGNTIGDVRVTFDTETIYIWSGSAWVAATGGGGGGVTSVTASLPLHSSGGLTPNITLSGDATDAQLDFVSASDATKKFKFDLSLLTASTTTTLQPLLTANTTLKIRPLVDTTGNIIVQNNTSGQIFIGSDATIGGANSGIQYSDATTANRGQIKLHSYFAGTSVSGVSTLTSRSGTVGINNAVVAGQDYSKWTAQAAATTVGSAPISGTFAFKANTVNSLTVTSDFHIQLTNLAGTLADRLYLSSEGLLQLPGYGAGFAQFDASGNITSVAGSTSFPLAAPEGSASAPSYAFSTTNKGIYGNGANSLGFATNGLTAGNIDANQAWTFEGTIITNSSIQVKTTTVATNYSVL